MKLMNLVMKKMKNKMDLYNLIPEEYITEDENPCWKGYEMIGGL